jgi:hypothetical protein
MVELKSSKMNIWNSFNVMQGILIKIFGNTYAPQATSK